MCQREARNISKYFEYFRARVLSVGRTSKISD